MTLLRSFQLLFHSRAHYLPLTYTHTYTLSLAHTHAHPLSCDAHTLSCTLSCSLSCFFFCDLFSCDNLKDVGDFLRWWMVSSQPVGVVIVLALAGILLFVEQLFVSTIGVGVACWSSSCDGWCSVGQCTREPCRLRDRMIE